MRPKLIPAGRLLVLCAVLFAGSVRAQPGLPPPVDIPIQNLSQQTPVWCWAAVAQQIIHYSVGPERTPAQCTLVALANNAHPAVCCSQANPACVRVGSLEQIQGLMLMFGGKFSMQAPPTDPLTLYRILQSGRPIILHVRSGMASSHVVILRGMSFVPRPGGIIPVLHINDPLAFFTQPVPYVRLLPLWINAIVVEPGSLRASPKLSKKIDEVSDSSDPPAKKEDSKKEDSKKEDSKKEDSKKEDSARDTEDADRCRDRCDEKYDKCIERIESVDDCLRKRVERCMTACVSGYGIHPMMCQMQACNPEVGTNQSWRPECDGKEERATRSCERQKTSCRQACSKPETSS